MKQCVRTLIMGVLSTSVWGCASASDNVWGDDESEVLGETTQALAGRWDGFFDGELPPDPVRRGTRYVCAALHEGDWHPGKLAGFRCYYSYGRLEYSSPSYQVLHAEPGFVWLPSTRGVPTDRVMGPVSGGGRSFAVCAVTAVSGEISFGKVYRGQCHHGWGGREELRSDFDYLANAPCSPHSVCRTGVALAHACDIPQGTTVAWPASLARSCVDEICNVDSFCCNNLWDAFCVGRVSSVCGGTCL